ncbi:MAG: diguanylate cyclase [Woeseia sp.]
MIKRLDLDKFPDSVYARELRNRRRRLRLAPELEAEYLDEHLRRVQPRVRIWTGIAALLGIGFTIAQVLEHATLNAIVLGHLLVILPTSTALMWLAWTNGHMQTYLRIAEPLAPLLGVAVAYAVASSVAKGNAEELASLTLLLIATFFFMGLQFRAALIAGASILIAYAIAASMSGVATPLLAKSVGFLAIAFALGATIGYEVEHSYRRRFLSHALMVELADRDGLTGLRNRRAFDEHLSRVWQQAMRSRARLAVLLVDIDYFKRYNDHYGHQAGDRALQKVSTLISGFARRPLDISARYGGEEFAIVAFDLADDAVADIAKRLCAAVESLQIDHAGSACSPHITISIGIGLAQPMINRSPAGLLQLADQALYAAKTAGRNGFVVHGQESYEILVTGAYKTSDS